MKSLLVFITVPFFSFAQDFNSALNFHNTIRGYYDLKPLTIDKELTDIAYNRVRIIAEAFVKFQKTTNKISNFLGTMTLYRMKSW